MQSIKPQRLSEELSPRSFIMTGLLLLSLGCGTVPILDHEFCGDMGSLGASCFHTLTAETRDIPKNAWEDLRFGQICTLDPDGSKGATFADLKATTEKLCSKCNCCTYEEKKQLEVFFEKVDQLNAKAVSLR